MLRSTAIGNKFIFLMITPKNIIKDILCTIMKINSGIIRWLEKNLTEVRLVHATIRVVFICISSLWVSAWQRAVIGSYQALWAAIDSRLLLNKLYCYMIVIVISFNVLVMLYRVVILEVMIRTLGNGCVTHQLVLD